MILEEYVVGRKLEGLSEGVVVCGGGGNVQVACTVLWYVSLLVVAVDAADMVVIV